MPTKRIFQAFSIISLFLAPVSVWLFSGSQTAQIVFPVFLILFSFFCIWFSRNELQAFGFLIILLPIAYKFNYFKFNLGNLLQFLGISYFSVNASFLLYLTIFFIFLMKLVFDFKSLKNNPLFIPFSLTILWAFLSILWSSYPAASLGQFVIFSLPFLFGLLGFYFSNKEGSAFPKIVYYVIVSSVFPILTALWQLISGDFFYEPDSGLGRLIGSFSHPNPFGLFLFFICSLLLIIFFSAKEKIMRKTILIYLFISTVFLILTYSRTAWISILFFLLILSYFIGRKIFNITILSGIIILILLLIYPVTQERIAGIFERTPFDSLYARESILKMSWQKFQENPILGYGTGTFEDIIRDVKESSEGSASAHNDISLVSLELGIIGLVLILFDFIVLFFSLLKTRSLIKKITFEIKHSQFNFDSAIFFKGLLTLFLVIFFITSLAESIFLKTILLSSFLIILGGWIGKNKKITN